MKKWAERFYKGTNWQQLRDTIMKRDGYLCQDCKARGKITPAEEVHHIIELTPNNINDASITLNPDNLVSLCRECHRQRHGAKRWKVDANGNVIIKV